MLQPLTVDPVIEFIEYNICKQRGDNAALWRSFFWQYDPAIRHFDRCFQNLPQHIKKMLVLYSELPNLAEQLRMVYVVKEAFDVKFYDIVEF